MNIKNVSKAYFIFQVVILVVLYIVLYGVVKEQFAQYMKFYMIQYFIIFLVAIATSFSILQDVKNIGYTKTWKIVVSGLLSLSLFIIIASGFVFYYNKKEKKLLS